MEHDTLARALSAINNAAGRGKTEVEITPASKVITAVLEILKREGYVESYSREETGSGAKLRIKITGQINKIGAIKPRYPVNKNEFEKFEQSYLPAKDFGRIIVSTSKGYMMHIEAKQKGLGGVLIAYVY
ncbi:MAG: 30S ribosomal protein S8 [DPANN group archaeon]|nr:30S ribosomal protein S8 [DPANN group archaeon]